MILSPSGWRGIFAEDGGEESSCRNISQTHKVIAAAAALVFSDYLSGTKGAIIVGRDTRPTGEAIADAVIRALINTGREVWYTGITAAPELMAFVRAKAQSTVGFIYISASHNPIGHNGIKFGLTDGGVLPREESVKLVSAFESFIASPSMLEKANVIFEGADKLNIEKLSEVYARETGWKNEALAAYMDFTGEVISGFANKTKREDFFASLKRSFEKRPVGIVADFNGSARTVSIDKDFFSSLGLGFKALNETPGQISHRIIPEDESLEPCRVFLESNHRADPSFVLGYVCDCDGDRGNIVITETGSDGKKTARILEAQELFALTCIAELSSMVRSGELKYGNDGKAVNKAALVVNDPTSIRIDRIASIFGVSVFRAEVGEANVVGLARKLREQGYLVRVFGEGSSGSAIIHPSAVRDPIDTIGAILKLLAIRKGESDGLAGMGLFEIWCNLSNQKTMYREDFTLADIIASIPPFVTTGAASESAMLKVKIADHSLLKNKYQEIYLREWEDKKASLFAEFGISDWEAIAYNGMEERRDIKRFGDAGGGGLKIEFSGPGREPKKAFIWMRGSGTEPVFRVIADAEGQDPRLERILIEWQRQMVLEANSA